MGNINASRDWGHAKDYVEAMWMTLQQSSPTDYIIASGKTHTVEHILNYCFTKIGLKWQDHVEHNDELIRYKELENINANNTKIKSLGWKPKYTFFDMLDDLMENWEKNYETIRINI